MKRHALLLPLFLLVVTASISQADTIHVPSQQSTIQAGINAAMDGDTVLVADGTYTGDGNENISFQGKGIVVMSEHGPKNCIIHPIPDVRGFHFSENEDTTSTLQGFTICDAYLGGNYGAAIRCDNSSPTIKNNFIKENRVHLYMYGAGIYCDNSSPLIVENLFTENEATCGGAIALNHSSPVIKKNVFRNNVGSAIYCQSSSPLIDGNTIENNYSYGLPYGGGIFCSRDCSPMIINNIIRWNSQDGGIVCYHDSSPLIRNNIVSFNSSDTAGGGIYCAEGGAPLIVGNIIFGNEAYRGGGLGTYQAYPVVWNNTITDNTAVYGGGVSCFVDSYCTISGTIIWGNDADYGKEIEVGIATHPSTLVIGYSDLQGSVSSIRVEFGCTVEELEGIIDVDPLFVLPQKNDYRLLWESPCIDASNPDSLDADGTRRDMGAHFFDQDDYLTLYLTPDTTETSRGSQLGVTYTAINRWPQPETFWHLTQAITPESDTLTVFGPDRYTLSGWKYSCTQCHQGTGYTGRIHKVHHIPRSAPLGLYEYRSLIGTPPGMLYDEDRFTFKVIE